MLTRGPFVLDATFSRIAFRHPSTTHATLCVHSSDSQHSPVRVDVIEDNWVVNANGTVGIRQIILWRWTLHNDLWSYYVVDWALQDKCSGVYPVGGEWVCYFRGRHVIGRFYRQTEYYYDVEVLDRQRLPEAMRSKVRERRYTAVPVR